MDEIKSISFKNFEGWIPETDVDGIDVDSKFVSDMHAMRFNNGFIENNVGIETLSLPSNVTSSVTLGYSVKSSFNFTHSTQGEKTIYVLWKASAASSDRLRVYLDNTLLVIGTNYIYVTEPNNINYSSINDEIKINLNCTATLYSRSIIMNLSLQYLDEVVYNNTNNVKRAAGWYLCPRWLSDNYETYYDKITIPTETETESFENNQPNNWKFMDGLSSLVGWDIGYGAGAKTGSYYLKTSNYNSYIKLNVYGYKMKFYAKCDSSSGDGARIIIEYPDGAFIQSFVLTNTYAEYELIFPSDIAAKSGGIIHIKASTEKYVTPFDSGETNIMSQISLDDISVYHNEEVEYSGDDINTILVAKYFDGQRSVMQSYSYQIYKELTYYNRLLLDIDDIDWRVVSYEIYANYSGTFKICATIDVDNNWIKSTNNVYCDFHISETDSSLDFNYNLPAESRVDNQSLIYMEASHKGRVYFIKDDFKVYQSHISGNGVIQPDSFPYDEEQGFGFFIVSRSRVNLAVCVSPTNDLVVITDYGVYVYSIQPNGSTVFRQLKMISGSVGISSRKSLCINSEGNPATQGLMWVDNNGLYFYSGGVTEPQNLLLPAHVEYWRQISSSHKSSIVGFYDSSRYEYSFEVNQKLISFEIPYKRFRISDFYGIHETVGYKGGSLYFRNNNDIYKFVSNIYSNGYFVTHYNSCGDESDDKIMQEISIMFSSTTNKSCLLNLYVYIDDNILVKTYTSILASDIYWKRLLPIRRFRKVKIKLEVSNAVKVNVREVILTYYEDKKEVLGVSS